MLKEKRDTVFINDVKGSISILSILPKNFAYLMVLGHGAGAGMEHHFMKGLAHALANVGIGTVRYNFPYMEKGGGGPDRPPIAHETIIKVVDGATQLSQGKPIVLAGKSFSGRMASQAMAKYDIEHVSALVFYGFPLHAPGKPGIDRAEHLKEVKIPMLFLQGTRDSLAQLPLLEPLLRKLKLATLDIQEGADHSFKFLKKSGIDQEKALEILARKSRDFLDHLSL